MPNDVGCEVAEQPIGNGGMLALAQYDPIRSVVCRVVE
jgi:hypothetical protein